MTDADRLWTVAEVASFLGVHPNTVYKLAADSRIPSMKVGSQLRFFEDDVRRYLQPEASTA